MNLRPWGIGALALLVALAAPSAISPQRVLGLRGTAAPGNAVLRAYGSRGSGAAADATTAKLDGALADITRHLSLVHPGTELADLHALHPAARFRLSAAGSPEVLVDAVTRGDPEQLKAALVALGLEHPALYSNDVGGWLPVAAVTAATARTELHSLRAAMPYHRAAVATQGDYAQRSYLVRSNLPTIDGSGVTVGVLSDSFDCFAVYDQANSGVPENGPTGYAFPGFAPTTAAQDEQSGALPSGGVNVLEEVEGGGSGGCNSYDAGVLTPYTDEGRAMLQIVHAVAPSASLAFYTADNGEAAFASGIEALQKAGATVEADDAGYFDEPMYQDGIVAQAIDTVEALGVAYFSAAGNDAEFAYETTTPTFTTQSQSGPNSGEYLLNFGPANAANPTELSVSIPTLTPGEFIAVVVQWDQPYVTGAPDSGGATSQIDLCMTASGNDLVTNPESKSFGSEVTCTGPNAVGADAYQVLVIGNPAVNSSSQNSAAQTLSVAVGLANGTPAPGRIRVAVLGDGVPGLAITSFATNSPTIQGHPLATGAAAVGAAFYFDTPQCGTTPPTLEKFSSVGGDPILFDQNGNRLVTPVTRQKPDFVGPDGVNDTFLGGSLEQFGLPSDTLTTNIEQCQTDATYPSFFGTSAAAPHAAGIAALMLQANAAATPAQIMTALRNSALSMGSLSPTYDYAAGYGLIQADAALALIPPATPTLTLSAASITVGQSATLTWSSLNATGCTASGSWSGALQASGSQSVMPTAAGSDSYTLACSNAAGTSAATTAVLTVTAPSSGHGGGALDLTSLLALGGVLGLCRRSRRIHALSGAGFP